MEMEGYHFLSMQDSFTRFVNLKMFSEVIFMFMYMHKFHNPWHRDANIQNWKRVIFHQTPAENKTFPT